MALPLGKLTILVGAGLVGSVLAKEGRLSDFFSGAFKIVVKQIQRSDDSSSSSGKPQNASLLAQVNSLRQELQLLASNRPVTIITGSRSGTSTFGAPVVVVLVVGYGYIWWKGWKLSDMMFATRRSLSDARASVAKQLEQVHSSITAAKRQLSSRIERVDSNIDECRELTSSTRAEVSDLQGEVGKFSVHVESVHRAVKTLETKIGQIEGKQDITSRGVMLLCDFAQKLDNGGTAASIQASPSSSKPALELPQISRTPRVLLQSSSLPPGGPGLLFLEPTSPPIQASPSTSSSEALELPQITPISKTSSMPREAHSTPKPPSTPSFKPPSTSSSNGASSSSSRFGWLFGNGAR